MPEVEVTWVDKDVCVCDNCGSFSAEEKTIIHNKICKSGESKKWEKIYSNFEEEIKL